MDKAYIEAMIYLAKNLLSSLEDARDMLIDETNENSPKPCATCHDTDSAPDPQEGILESHTKPNNIR
jgi:hypothetical protein